MTRALETEGVGTKERWQAWETYKKDLPREDPRGSDQAEDFDSQLYFRVRFTKASSSGSPP